MTITARRWPICFAGISGAIAILVAASTAHGGSGDLLPEDLARLQIAVRYQIWHALALLATAALTTRAPSALLQTAAMGFALGSVLFCGGLYLLAFTGFAQLAWMVPLGGLAFAFGWLVLAWHGWRLAAD